jgi:hypothetical protein
VRAKVIQLLPLEAIFQITQRLETNLIAGAHQVSLAAQNGRGIGAAVPTRKHARVENIPEPGNEAKIVHSSTSVGDSSRIPSPGALCVVGGLPPETRGLDLAADVIEQAFLTRAAVRHVSVK